MTAKIQLYQIAYDIASYEAVRQSEFLLLDNLDNSRPDWYEYWPIRKFLSTTTLKEDTWYGFFSPKFSQKTSMCHADVCAFVADADNSKLADVCLFSPQPDMGANFLSVFEQAEVFDPGFNATARDFLRSCDLDVPLDGLIMDARQTVFSNYFVAKSPFWRLWFDLTERLFDVCENGDHPLNASLCFQTNYGANAQRKVFLLERLASLLLVLHPEFRAVPCNPYGMGWSMSRFREHPQQTYINDALKMAYRELGYPQYMEAFNALRNQFVGKS